MSQTWDIDTIVPASTPPSSDIQKMIDGFNALRSCFSGATEPASADQVAYMLWADTTAGLLKIRNAANSAWVTVGTLAATNLGLLSLAGGNLTGGVNAAKTTVASATTPDIFATTVGNLIDYTGTATCTGFVAAPQAGCQRTLVCAGAPAFTAGANMLIDGIASGSNFTAAVGDKIHVLAVTTTQFRLTPAKYNGQSVAPSTAPLAGHLWGCTLSNNGTDATNDIDATAGEAASDDALLADRVLMALSALTKQLDAAWAVGNNAGGRMSAAAIADGTYHVWIIQRPDTGVVDWGFDVSATAPTMPANYTKKRRIGSILREAGAIVAFVQTGDLFQRKSPVLDVNATNPGVSAVSRTLSVPIGIEVEALLNVILVNSSAGASTTAHLYLSPLSANDEAPSLTAAPLATIRASGLADNSDDAPVRIMTNASGQIRSRLTASDASTIMRIALSGHIDRRGRES
jgi:hypothetical protein